MKQHARATALLMAVIAAIGAVTSAATSASQDRAKTDKPDPTARLIEALELHDGSIVAEMGAGAGARTMAIAKHVGPTGRVYSSELGASSLDKLRKAIEAGGVPNVTIVEGAPSQTNMPEQCCDALFMENVYHHFDDPAAMDASIFRTVKPGGRVAIVDFTPPKEAERPQDRDTDGHHGVMPETVQAELAKAGFELIKVEKRDKPDDRGFLVVMRKPLQ